MKDRTMGNAQNCGNGADNLTDWLDNVESLTFHDPIGLLRGWLLLLLCDVTNLETAHSGT
jgi:hypothetical protein